MYQSSRQSNIRGNHNSKKFAPLWENRIACSTKLDPKMMHDGTIWNFLAKNDLYQTGKLLQKRHIPFNNIMITSAVMKIMKGKTFKTKMHLAWWKPFPRRKWREKVDQITPEKRKLFRNSSKWLKKFIFRKNSSSKKFMNKRFLHLLPECHARFYLKN